MAARRLAFSSAVLVAAFGIALTSGLGFAAHAQSGDQIAAIQSAIRYVDQIDTADLGQVYDEDLSDSFHQFMNRKTFIDTISVARVQAGGVHQSREMTGAVPFDHLPTGQTGQFFYIRFRTHFPNGTVFQDVYLQKAGADWKVAASLALPAPPQ